MNKAKKSSFNLIFGIANQLIILILGLIIPRLFIVNFGSELNGIQSSIAYIYTYIALLESGIGTATIQALYGPLGTDNKDDVNSILSATNRQYKKIAVFYLLCMVAFAFIYPLTINTTYSYTTIFLMVLLSGVSSLCSFLIYAKYILLLQADGRSFIVSIYSLVIYICTNIVKIITISVGRSIVEVYICTTLISIIPSILYSLYIRKKYPWINLKVTPNKKAISQSKNVLVHQISSVLCNSTDVLVLTYIVKNLKLVSVYNIYLMVFDAIKSLILNIFSSVTFIMGQTYNTDKEKYKKYHTIYEIADFYVSFVLYTVGYLMVTPFMKLYTASVTDINYIDKYIPLMFVLVKLLTSGREPASQLINYAGHFKKTQWRSIAETAINVVVSIVASYFIGIYGVLLGTIIALLYRTIDMYIYTSRRFLDRSVWQSYKQWLIHMSAFIVLVFIFWNIDLNASNYFELLLYAIICGIGSFVYYAAVTSIFNFKTIKPYVKFAYHFIKNKIAKKGTL